MSKLPRINSTRTDILNTTNSTNNNTQEIIQIPQTPINKPIKNISPLLYETKLTQLESKIINLEQTNEILLNRIGQNEIKFEVKIQELDNRTKSNIMNNNNIDIKDSSQIETPEMNQINELKTKINYLEKLFDKQEEWKVNQRKKDLEMYKLLLEKLNASISQTVQLEITERFKGDIANKNQNEKFLNKYENEMSEFKRNFEETSIQLKNEIMEFNNQTSEKIQNLTKYIDIEINKVNSKNSNNSLQNFVQKLTEQIKNNLVNQNYTNDLYEKRITNLEKLFPLIQEDNKKLYNEIEKRCVNKIMEIKQYIDLNLRNSHNILNNQMTDMSNKMSTNINFLIQHLIRLSNEVKNQFENDKNLNDERFKVLIEDLEQLTNRQYQLENIFNKNLESYKQLYDECKKEIKDFDIKFDVSRVNDRLIRNLEIMEIYDSIEQTNNLLNNFKAQTINNMNLMTENSNDINGGIMNKVNSLSDTLNDLILNNKKMFEKIEKDSNEIQTKQIINEMLFKMEENDILNEIFKVKDLNLYLGKNIKNNSDSINKIESQLINILSTIDNNGGEMGNMKELLKEKEEKQEVIKIMNELVTNVEKEIEENKFKLQMKEIKESFLNCQKQIKSLKSEIDELNNKSNINLENEFLSKQNINKSNMGMNEQEVNNSLNQMLNNIEFQNIYSILNKKGLNQNQNIGNIDNNDLNILRNQIRENNEITKKALVNYSDVIDNKINSVIEKFKKENIDMWTNAVQLSQKYTQPEEIKKLISEVPPAIIPSDQSKQDIMNLNYEHENPKPFVGDLDNVKDKVEEERYGKSSSKGNSKNKKSE